MALASKALTTLEFDKVIRRLMDLASFSVGKRLAEALVPHEALIRVDRLQQETEEAATLISKAGPAPFGGLSDIAPIVRRAAIGAVLGPNDLLDVADAVRGIEQLKRYLLQHAPLHGAESLRDLGLTLETFGRLEERIKRCIDAEGLVVDHASPELARLRARLRSLKQRAREHLDRLVRSPKGQRVLQEPIVTLRAGRYVVPVRQEYRGDVPGIVHDQSSSGATLFIEPLPVVEINNEVRQVEREEEAEVERILLELSGLVAADEARLLHSLDIAGALDLIFAKGRLAIDMDATRPIMNGDGRIVIRKGRHPLLQGEVVPIDLELGTDFTALVITGPNTGGKTVTLKTVGLFALMAQAGLHVPAEPGTELGLFRQVFADIGDEQSIEQNLSTFSSHMTHIVEIVRMADGQSLVLLDELGAGTDPTEGAALAIALIERLINAGCRVVATTHYSELKSFAYNHPQVENASVEFDVETLRPTYRLSMGVAGKSNAFAISARLGLDAAIIARAEAELTDDERKVDDLIRRVEHDVRQAEKDREEAEKLKGRYAELFARYHEAFSELQEARQAVIEEARREAKAIVARAEREVDALIGRLRKAGQSSVETEAAEVRRRLRGLTQESGGGQGESTDEASVSRDTVKAMRLEDLIPGTPVLVRSLGKSGVIVQTLGDGKLIVQVGAMKMTAAREDLAEDRASAVEQAPSTAPAKEVGARHIVAVKSNDVKREVDLRGMTVEEAVEATDKYIDDALVAGLSKAWIIHGKGTGALRRSIQDFLRSHPRVKAFRSGDHTEGGTGVTVVDF